MLRSILILAWLTYACPAFAIAATNDLPIDVIPRCGISSVYALLRLNGISASFDDVSRRFEQFTEPTNQHAHSLYDVRTVCESYGLHVRSVYFPSLIPSAIPTPCIIFLPSTISSHDVGHFALLESINETKADFVDFGVRTQRTNLDIARLKRRWKGRALVVIAPPQVQTLLAAQTALAVTITVAVIVFIRRRSRRRSVRNHQPPDKPTVSAARVPYLVAPSFVSLLIKMGIFRTKGTHFWRR